MDYETEVAIPRIARDVLKNYYRSYISSFGEPMKAYMKLLMDAGEKDKEEIIKAFEKAFKEVDTDVYKEATAEFLEVAVEDIEGVFKWSAPEESGPPLI